MAPSQVGSFGVSDRASYLLDYKQSVVLENVLMPTSIKISGIPGIFVCVQLDILHLLKSAFTLT